MLPNQYPEFAETLPEPRPLAIRFKTPVKDISHEELPYVAQAKFTTTRWQVHQLRGVPKSEPFRTNQVPEIIAHSDYVEYVI